MITLDVGYCVLGLFAIVCIFLTACFIDSTPEDSGKGLAIALFVLALVSTYACGRYAGNVYPDKPRTTEARSK